MSLPTPPRTCESDKENRIITPGARVAWSAQNQYHIVTGNSIPLAEPSATKRTPKSILKKTSYIVLPLLQVDVNKRESTPEPSDPVSDASYLESPVSRIIASDASLRDLIEAYSILAARLKPAIAGAMPAHPSLPLFQPLNNHAEQLVESFVRDLGRAMENPPSLPDDPEHAPQEQSEEEKEQNHLPSPLRSPKRKKGMTAEQVKYARDLCTTCHAVLKLLSFVLALPFIYRIFSDAQLKTILTAVLGIPLASDLPTPNARKTWALAISLLQGQRLPAEILIPARDRITYALRRGIEGELGKEGKKGASSDGLKAIHDLAVYQPSTFLPTFTELLPSILDNLMAPTLALRTQACHALGGLVLGCTSHPRSYLQTRFSEIASDWFLPQSGEGSSPRSESLIIRTLRATLTTIEPEHVAQGPVWGLCVLANLIVLVGPALKTNAKLARVFEVLLNVGRRHPKSSVRALGCIVWRCLIWTYFQPPLVEDDDTEKVTDSSAASKASYIPSEEYWATISSEVELEAGTATVAAILGGDSTSDDELDKALHVVYKMVDHGGSACSLGVDVLKQLVDLDRPTPNWHVSKLLPRPLFAALPGLLSADFRLLASFVKPIMDRYPMLDEVRPLTREELSTEWVFQAIMKMWKKALRRVALTKVADMPPEMAFIWEGLLKSKIAVFQDGEEALKEFAEDIVNELCAILQDPEMSFIPDSPSEEPASSQGQEPSASGVASKTGVGATIKLAVIRDLWSTSCAVIPHSALSNVSEKLLSALIEYRSELSKKTDEGHNAWADFCTDLVLVDADGMEDFWESKLKAIGSESLSGSSIAALWKSCAARWRSDVNATWEGTVFLLGLPFAAKTAWEMEGEDCDVWEDLLRFAMEKGLDIGTDAVSVLDYVAEAVSQGNISSCTRVADLLLTHLDITEAHQVPDALFAFVNDVLVSTYQHESRNNTTSMWMIRSFTRIVDACPSGLRRDLLEVMQDGLSLWLTDSDETLTQEEYIFNLLPLYESILIALRPMKVRMETLQKLSALLGAPFQGRPSIVRRVSDMFRKFWEATFAAVPKPKRGWPGNIQACLDAIKGGPDPKSDEADYESDASADELNVIDPQPKLPSQAQEDPNASEDELPTFERALEQKTKRPQDSTSPRVEKSGEHKRSPFAFTGIGASFVRLMNRPNQEEAPSMPTEFRPRTPERSSTLPLTATPSRPRKKPLAVFPLPSLHSKTTKNRLGTPHRSKRGNSEKENQAPDPFIVSPGSPTRSSCAVLGKRRLSDDDEGNKTKKARIECAEKDDDDNCEERLVATSLTAVSPTNIFTTPQRRIKPVPLSRIRQGVFLEAVELPTLRLLNKRNGQKFRVRDGAKTTGDYHLGDDFSLKRHHNEELEEFLSTPTRPAQRRRLDNKGMNLTLSLCEAPHDGSSDDDPHLGQVTPHHLISPPVARRFDEDPPSDGSMVSPSRDVVARRAQRSSSLYG